MLAAFTLKSQGAAQEESVRRCPASNSFAVGRDDTPTDHPTQIQMVVSTKEESLFLCPYRVLSADNGTLAKEPQWGDCGSLVRIVSLPKNREFFTLPNKKPMTPLIHTAV